MRNEINVEINASNVNDLYKCFDDTCCRVLDTHASLTTRSRIVRPRPPWYTDDLLSEKQEQRRLERKWRKNGTAEDEENYRKQLLRYNKLIEDSKKKHFTDVLNTAGPKETFQTLDILPNRNEKILPSHTTFPILV